MLLFSEIRQSAGRLFCTLALLAAAFAATDALAATTLTAAANVNVTRLTDSQTDSVVAINPGNPSNVVCVSNRSTTIYGITISVSNDGGGSWTSTTLNINQSFSDLSWDSMGNLFLVTQTSATNNYSHVLYLSTNGGGSFSVIQTLTTTGNNISRPKLATGPDGSGFGSVWLTYADDGLGSVVATGAQVTGIGTVGAFGSLQIVPSGTGTIPESIAVGPAGEVMIAMVSENGDGTSTFGTAIDTDGVGVGIFTSQPVTFQTGVGNRDGIPAQQSFGISPRTMLAWDRSGGQFSGRVYLVYTEENPNGGNDTDILLISSNNAGVSWSNPVRVNDDASTLSQFLPSIALDQTTGNVAVGFYDCRFDAGTLGAGDNDAIANTDTLYFVTVSDNGGASFLTNLQVSAGSTNSAAADNTGTSVSFGVGACSGLAFQTGRLIATWSDNSNSTSDNPDGQLNYLDVYAASVNVLSSPNVTPNPNEQSDVFVSAITPLTQPVAGSPFAVSVTVENNGPSDASAFYVSLFSDPAFVGLNDSTVTNFSDPDPAQPKKVDVGYIPGLAAGDSVNVVLTMLYNYPGSATIAALADSQASLFEANELNNEFDQRLTVVSPTTDLIVTSMAVTNTNPGTDATFDVTVQNRGNQTTGAFNVGFYANRAIAPVAGDAPDSAQPVASLTGFGTAGDSTTLTFTLPTQNVVRGGRAWVLADSDNAIVEQLEDNNAFSAVWGVVNDAPAILSVLSANPTGPATGEAVTFSVGAGDPNGDPLSYVYNFGDGTPPVSGGASVQHTFATPGQYTVKVTVSDGPFTSVQSQLTIQVLDSTIVNLGTIFGEGSKVNILIPLPAGLTKRDHAKTKIVEGLPGPGVKLRGQRLIGKAGAPKVYTFTVEYLVKKTKKVIRVRYKYTVLPLV